MAFPRKPHCQWLCSSGMEVMCSSIVVKDCGHVARVAVLAYSIQYWASYKCMRNSYSETIILATSNFSNFGLLTKLAKIKGPLTIKNLQYLPLQTRRCGRIGRHTVENFHNSL